MRRLTFFFVILLAACSNRTDIPNDVIQPDSMRIIFKEVIMAESYSDQYISRDSLKPDKVKANQDLLEGIFAAHHITRREFVKSLSFYESRPDLNKKIFDSLAAYANKHKADLYTPKPVKPKTGPEK